MVPRESNTMHRDDVVPWSIATRYRCVTPLTSLRRPRHPPLTVPPPPTPAASTTPVSALAPRPTRRCEGTPPAWRGGHGPGPVAGQWRGQDHRAPAPAPGRSSPAPHATVGPRDGTAAGAG